MGGNESVEENQYVRDVQAASTAIRELYEITNTLESSLADGSYEALAALKKAGQKRVREIVRRLKDLKKTDVCSRRMAHLEKLEIIFQKQQFEFELSCLKLAKLDRTSARSILMQSERRSVGQSTSRMDDAEAAIQAIDELILSQGDHAGNASDSKGESPRSSKSTKRILEVDAMRRQVFYRKPPSFMERVGATPLLLGGATILVVSYAIAKVAFASTP